MLTAFYPWIGAFLIGLSKAGFATGLGLLTTPLLASAIPAKQAIGVILPLLCISDFLTLTLNWKKWRWSLIRSPLLGAFVGIACGMFFIHAISDIWLKRSIGLLSLILVSLLFVRNRWYPTRIYTPTLWEALAVGVFAGFASTVAHAAGPIMALYLLAQKVDKKVFVASNAIFFTINNLMKVPPYVFTHLITGSTLKADLWYLPAIPLGVLVGYFLNRMLPQKVFYGVVYVLLLLSAFQLLRA